ncbi:hypothetical protein BS17DRAFT_810400 [Gyrodon lividus]|nr:hypothetical protein BS17DRAFT_810400 [Gyrodon lividus]
MTMRRSSVAVVWMTELARSRVNEVEEYQGSQPTSRYLAPDTRSPGPERAELSPQVTANLSTESLAWTDNTNLKWMIQGNPQFQVLRGRSRSLDIHSCVPARRLNLVVSTFINSDDWHPGGPPHSRWYFSVVYTETSPTTTGSGTKVPSNHLHISFRPAANPMGPMWR